MIARYTVSTHLATGGRIELRTQSQFDDVRETIMRQVVESQDAAVRAALIKLGWTPPPDHPVELPGGC